MFESNEHIHKPFLDSHLIHFLLPFSKKFGTLGATKGGLDMEQNPVFEGPQCFWHHLIPELDLFLPFLTILTSLFHAGL